MHTNKSHNPSCWSDKRYLLRFSRARNRPFTPCRLCDRRRCRTLTCARFGHKPSDQKDSQASPHTSSSVLGDHTVRSQRSFVLSLHLSMKLARHLQDHTHIGITPGQPDTPQHPSSNRSGSFVLALAVFVGVAWGLVTFSGQLSARLTQKQPRQKQTPPQTAQASTPPPTPSLSRRDKRRSKTDAVTATSTSKPATSRSNIICRNFAATGSCRFGDRCHYKHIYVPAPFRADASLRSASPPVTDDDYDSTTESDSEDPVASTSAPSRISARVLGKYMDQIGNPYAPSPLQTLKQTYHVPPELVSASLCPCIRTRKQKSFCLITT